MFFTLLLLQAVTLTIETVTAADTVVAAAAAISPAVSRLAKVMQQLFAINHVIVLISIKSYYDDLFVCLFVRILFIH